MLRNSTGSTMAAVLINACLWSACTGSVGSPDQNAGGGDDLPSDDSATDGPSASGPCRITVPIRRLTELQYKNAIRDIFAQQAVLPADFTIPNLGAPTSGFSNDPEYNAVDLGVARRLNDSAISVPISVVDKLSNLLPCASTPNDACAQTFIETYGRRAYRRPLEDAETATLMKAFKLGTGADAFKDGIAAVVATILEAPQFLYQSEIRKAPDDSTVAQLSGYEIASRLSLLLWDSVPDDALLDAAAAGELDNADGIRGQVDRLLSDAKARSVMIRFAREWIHLPSPVVGQRADKAFTEALAGAMQRDFDDFIANSFLGENTTLESFFSSTEPYENATLDTFIKTNGGYGDRSGLLTHPAVLTGLAGASDTSPIRRSVFVRTKVTCESFPSPPDDAVSVESALPLPADATQRQRSAARGEDVRCAGCHNLIDPLGFGFENFDELGRFRETNKDGSALDASGEFVDPVSKDLAGTFASLPELGERLGRSPAVAECLSRQFFRFNYGRMEGEQDSCSIKGIARRFKASGLGLRDLIVSVATADEFRFRKVQ